MASNSRGVISIAALLPVLVASTQKIGQFLLPQIRTADNYLNTAVDAHLENPTQQEQKPREFF